MEEFRKAFQQIYKKQDVEDNSETIRDFLDSGDDMLPSQWRNQDFFQGGQRISYFPKISRFQKPLFNIFHEGQEGIVLVTYQLIEGKQAALN